MTKAADSTVEWYHTFELAPGEETPGWFDLRPLAPKMPIPADLTGKRCLDIGTFDGFWAFEMERRGGEVMAIDVLNPEAWDWPGEPDPETIAALERRKRGSSGFRVMHEHLGSAVEHRGTSVYDLDPNEHGQFDVIYMGSLLIHLRDPIGALQRVRGVLRGRAIFCDAHDPLTSALLRRRPLASLEARGRPWWWRPNIAALERMVDAAGMRRVSETAKIRIPPGKGRPRPPVRPATLRSRSARRELLDCVLGDPHAIIVAEP